MTTEKIYYADSHAAEFSATVLECRAAGEGYGLILDRTAFFPEGGGQNADTGYIGASRVSDVQEHNGEIVHFCRQAQSVGAELLCGIDYERRYRRMQNHSGEHIFSGISNALHGYNNVGFHMGEDCMTLDFSGELDEEQLEEIETKANLAVRANLPVITSFPSPEELEALSYRSKLEMTENVRIVEIEGIDRCACCAPHVKHTGEIGIIKVLDFERHRGGVRISLVCGMDALDDYRLKQENIIAISRALSVKRRDTGAAVTRLMEQQQKQKERSDMLSMELVRLKSEAAGETAGNICVFDELLDETALRELVNLLMDKCGGLAAAFSGSEEAGWKYIIGSKHIDLRAESRHINALIEGKGGGSAQMLQGRASAGRETIKKNIIDSDFRQK